MGDGPAMAVFTEPNAPDELLVEYDQYTRTAKIAWEPRENCDYIVKSWTAENPPHEDKTSLPNFALNNLQPGCKYNVQVKSIIRNRDDKVSEFSQTLSFYTAPNTPTRLRVTQGSKSPETTLNIDFENKDSNFDMFEVSLRSRLTGKIEKKCPKECFARFEKLTPGDKYDAWVVAVKGGVRSENCKTDEPVQTRPEKTQDVNVIRSSATSCTVSWKEVFGAESYSVKYRRKDKNYEFISTKDTEFTLENLDGGHIYKICVAAKTLAFTGEYSDPKTFTTDLPAPSNIRVEPIYSNKEVKLEVKFDSSHECDHVVTANIEGERTARTEKTKTSRAVLNDIPLGSNVLVSVHAIADSEAEGRKIYAEPVWIRPGVVTGVSTVAISKNSEKISWKPVPGATSYVSKLEHDGKVVNFRENCAQTVLKDLELNTKFSISVAAVNEGGTGEFSDHAMFQTALSPASDIQVRNFSSQVGPGLNVTWKGCEGAFQYNVDILEAQTNKLAQTHVLHKSHHEFYNLQLGFKYKVRIQCIAEDRKKNSDETFSESVWTCPGQVSAVMVMPDTKTTRTVAWEEIEGEDVTYELTLKKAGSPPEIFQTEKNSFFLGSLELSSDYTAYVTSKNSGGRGKESVKVHFETALFAPTNLKVANNANHPTTAFDTSFDEPLVPAPKYLIRAINLHGNPDKADEYRSNNVIIRGLQPGESYRVGVTSLHATDRSLDSEETILTSPIWTKLPGFAVEYEMVRPDQCKLTWQDGADSCQVQYRIKNGEWQCQKVSANEIILKQLKLGENYEAYVIAINQAGKGDKSKAVHFATAPPKPLNLGYKIRNTLEFEISCDSCHGATNYIFDINDNTYIEKTPTYRLEAFDHDHIKVQIRSSNEAGTSEISEVLEFRQTLNFVRKKFHQIAANIIKKDNFIMPVLQELSSGDKFESEDFQIFNKETVLLTGGHFTGKTSFCGYFLQELESSKLGIYIDYDKIKNIGGKHNIKSLLQKYMTDVTQEEMNFLIEWMKNNSEDVVFVVDNFEFSRDHEERQVAYDAKEAPMHVIQAILKTNRELFPNSQVLCTTSQTSLKQLLRPEKTWEITGFGDEEVEKMRRKISPNVEIPPHLRLFCTVPSYCEIILRLLKSHEDVDMTSCSSVLIGLLIRSLGRYTENKCKEKLRQMVDEIKSVPDMLKIAPKDPEKVKKSKKGNAGGDAVTSPGFSDVQTYQEFPMDGENVANNKSCKVLYDYIKVALYYALFSPYKEFQKRLQKKAINLGIHSHIWIMTSGLLRNDTTKRAIEMVFNTENLSEEEVQNKFTALSKFIKDNMVRIWKQIYVDPHIALDWLSCCNELNREDLLNSCERKIRFSENTTVDEVEKAARFVKYLPRRFCQIIRIKTTTEDPTKTLPIDRAIRENPYGELIKMKDETNVEGSLGRKVSRYESIRDRARSSFLPDLDEKNEELPANDNDIRSSSRNFNASPLGSPQSKADLKQMETTDEVFESEGASNEDIKRTRADTNDSQKSTAESYKTIESGDSQPRAEGRK